MKHTDDLDLTISEAEDEKGSKKGIKALFASKLFLVVMAGVLMAVTATVWVALKPSEDQNAEDKAPPSEAPKHMAQETTFFPAIIDLGMFEVPLGDMGGERSLKVGIRIQGSTPALKQEIGRRSVQVKSTITSLIGIKTLNEITGVDGKIVLKKDIIAGLNRMLETGKAINVYFSEFVIY